MLSITLDREAYWPGEYICGILTVQSIKPLQCNALRLKFQGKGKCSITEGSGDARSVYSHKKQYGTSLLTVWGNGFRTEEKPVVANGIVFGSSSAPEEGVIRIPYSAGGGNDIVHLEVVCSGLKFSKISIPVLEIVDKGTVELDLFLENSDKREGTLSLLVAWESDPNLRFENASKTLRLQLQRVSLTNTKTWLGSNRTAFVVASYPVELLNESGSHSQFEMEIDGGDDISKSNNRFDTIKRSLFKELPAGELSIPFQFLVPYHLPSSFHSTSSDQVVYTVKATLDTANWTTNPKCTKQLLIHQPCPVASIEFPEPATSSFLVHPKCCLPPFCCCAFSVGILGDPVKFRMHLRSDKNAYSTGEVARVTLKVENSLDNDGRQSGKVDISSFQLCLIQRITTAATGRTRVQAREVVRRFEVNYDHEKETEASFEVPISSMLPPTFEGQSDHLDPVSWSYQIQAIAIVKDRGLSVLSTHYGISIPVIVGASRATATRADGKSRAKPPPGCNAVSTSEHANPLLSDASSSSSSNYVINDISIDYHGDEVDRTTKVPRLETIRLYLTTILLFRISKYYNQANERSIK